MKNKVVLLVLIIFTAFSINASDFSQGEGTIGVTFATNSNIDTIKYYADALKTTLIDSSSRIEMKEGDTIYVSFNNSASNFYDFLGFDLYWYDENGKRKEAPIRINSTSEIVLPSSSEFYSEISVEPYGKFKDRTISFSDSVDGIEIDNEWKINDETYTGVTSASINAVIPYSVSYRYDPNLYYIKSVSPENRIIVAGNGSIIFFEETPSSSTRSNNLVTNYSVQIKPYVHVSLPDSNLFTRDRIKRIVLSNGKEIEKNKLSMHGFKVGDTFLIETDRDWVLEGKGIKVVQNNLTTESRVYSVTILDNNDYDISLSLTQTKVYSISFEMPEIKEDEMPPRISISFGDERYSDYDQIREKNSMDLEEGETIYFNITNSAPDRERIKCIFTFADGHNEESGYVRTGEYQKVFNFSDKEETNLVGVLLQIDYGFYFSPMIENDPLLDVNYYIKGGRQLTEETFLTDGTDVQILVKNCPADREIVKSNVAEVEDEENKENYKVTISENTKLSDFRITTRARKGFYFDPSSYRFENGEISFYVDGALINSPRFIENGKKIAYKGQANEGYQGLDGKIEVNGDYTDELLRSIKFKIDEPCIIKLNQPEFGGSIEYYYPEGIKVDGGKESINAKRGETIIYKLNADAGFIPVGNNQIKYTVGDEREQALPTIAYPFVESEDHKPILYFDINNAPDGFEVKGSIEDFIFENKDDENKVIKETRKIVVSEKEAENYDEENEENNVSWDEIGGIFSKSKKAVIKGVGTHNSIKFEIRGVNLINKNEQSLKITRIDTMKDDTQKVTYIYDNKANFDYKLDFPNKEKTYKTIELKFDVVDGFYHKVHDITNANIKIYSEAGDVIEEGDFVEPDTEVVVEITPAKGFYITGKNIDSNGSYRKTMKYSEYYEDINDIVKDHAIIKYISINLPEKDKYGSYSYENEDGTIHSGLYSRFREGSTLEVTFSANEEYEIKRHRPFADNKNIKVDVEITRKMDNTNLTIDNLGIEVKEVQE